MEKKLSNELGKYDNVVTKVKRDEKNKNINGILYNIPVVSKCTSESLSSNYYGSGVGGYGLNII